MALSGSLNTSAYESRYLILSWTATQSVENNNSTISWTLKGAGGTSTSYYMAGGFKVVINGVTVYSKDTDYRIELFNGTTVASGTLDISHNTDGTKSFSASVEAGIYSYAVNKSGSATFTLNAIPRKATITAANNFTDEDNPTINYSNLAGDNVTSLKACISIDGSKDDIAYRDISKTGTTYTFNLTEAERNVLRSATKDSNTLKIKFCIQTVIGGETYTHYLEKMMTIVYAIPSVTFTAQDNNSSTVALTGDNQKLIKYHSNISYSISATPKKGATIASYKITCGGTTLTTATGTFNNVETDIIEYTVTDSRGNAYNGRKTFTQIAYIKLTANLDIGAPNADGTLNFAVKGNYYNGSIGVTNNTITIQYRYKSNSGNYTEWITAPAAYISGTTYTSNISITGLDYQSAYTFQARALDKISTVNSEEKKIKTTPMFDWSDEDFNFNVPIKLKGQTVLRHNGTNNNIILSCENATNGIFLRPNGTGSDTGQAILQPDGKLKLAEALEIAEGGTGATTAATARTNLGLGAKGDVNTPVYIASGGVANCNGNTLAYQTNTVSTNSTTDKTFTVNGTIVACFITMKGDNNSWAIDLTINANSGAMAYSCYGRINNSVEEWGMNAYISDGNKVVIHRYSGATTNINCYCTTLYVPN